mmetsp:Transcript_16461/g.19027  ORF Transcript_16461/g.19027 Transcript_16461/m.19027 type:complete len:82 (-) Transcript_16461:82-327(-)
MIFTLLINFTFSIWIERYPPGLSVLSLHVFLLLQLMTSNGCCASELDIDLPEGTFLDGFQFAKLNFKDFDKIIFVRPYLAS